MSHGRYGGTTRKTPKGAKITKSSNAAHETNGMKYGILGKNLKTGRCDLKLFGCDNTEIIIIILLFFDRKTLPLSNSCSDKISTILSFLISGASGHFNQ